LPVLDQVVDHPALQFQRHDFQQEHRDGQKRQDDLMFPGRPDDIAKDAAIQSDRLFVGRADHFRQSPGHGVWLRINTQHPVTVRTCHGTQGGGAGLLFIPADHF